MFSVLNRWQWAGIFLSILWIVAAGSHVHNSELEDAKGLANLSYKDCTNKKLLEQNNDFSSCELERQQNIDKWLKDDNRAESVAFWALAPLPFGWLASFILLYVVRAQIAGFRAVVPWARLSLKKRLFVGFCSFASFVAVLLGAAVAMNLYVDTKIPVSLSLFKHVNKLGGDFVTVDGTWTRPDRTDDPITNPLQASKIECSKQERQCVEAKAYVSGNLLVSDLAKYSIRSWTADSVIFVDEDECSETVYTIDLNTKNVSGAGHLTNQESISCKMDFKPNWSLLLTNGFNVYWQERQKARPAFLKMIQAAFGL